ncbi:aldo/keto reductase [Clostridium estertheticum]|uniref:Aldo/keto reductase n=1 Tax=Clostridium estertheticum subsp. estertheticum TaxID=1552 RepID=A0A1J0GKL2_9CLOT|nr:aldo/keto reductase [Clostridium estertheticum]APC41488.1 aldo/keto reductase [Clostridium estertheticum subsp. estertheticum]MBU3072797.1 aldo/keto reductase [Clostridium estertheticum]MBU3163166.1 aldo/keto reductase [Clostridium estertheticum]MBU3183872.1 aldo/keto reductase [Clostridium estertheticum]MBZ9616603.1 aldo/keto reductase [Clostridium estertheticum subsp. laramiense]
MLYRKFGKTNEMVSALGFGCMRLPILPGGNQSQIDEEKSMKLVRFAIDEGVNYIDTAYPYHGTGMGSGGASEPFVAKVLKDGYREKVKLATKLPSWLIKTREDMDKYLNEQLQRLETDSIDFYLVHALNVDTWATLKTLGISEFLDAAIKDGRIKYAGFSFHDKLPLFKEIVDYYDWSFCQIQYNYLDEDFQAGTEGLKYASQKGLGITIMEPLRGGKLAANLPKEAINVFDKADVKRTPVDWALSWVWNHPEVSVILSGMNEMKQIVENIKTANMAKVNSLTDEELKIVTKVKTVIEEKVKVSCTACEYCMPCPAGVNIPKNFTFYNNHFMFDKEENYSLAVPNKERASNCIECGKCETHCPQGILIRAELKNVKALFE